MNIQETIQEILQSEEQKSGFDKLIITIECPLPSGIRLLCIKEKGKTKERVPIKGNIRNFFDFVRLEKKARSDRFNIVTIINSAASEPVFAYSFDNSLQKTAEKAVE